MAKGLRATSRKRNNAKLRATVFGPAHDARTARLSAKLQEIASKPRPREEGAMHVDENEDMNSMVNVKDSDGGMDVDAENAKMKPVSTSSKHTSRLSKTEKKIAKRKAKQSIVFKQDPLRRRRAAKSKGRKR